MAELPGNERVALDHKLRGLKGRILEGVLQEYGLHHPDPLAHLEEHGRELCREDIGYHLEFLAAALESGVSAAFAAYVRWAAGVLQARGMSPRALVQCLHLLGRATYPHFEEPQRWALASYLSVGMAAAGEPRNEGPGSAATEGLGSTRELFLQALLHGQRKAACTIALEAVRRGHPIPAVYAEVLGEALREVGQLWECNRISVAAEHTATGIVQLVLAQLYPLLPVSDSPRGNAIITAVQGELHQVGANMVADVLEASGWNVRFLGANVPHGDILRAVEEHQADAVGISAATLLSLAQVRRLVVDLRQGNAGRRPRIVVGGAAFRVAPNLADEIGADAWGTDLLSVPDLFAGAGPVRS